MNTRFLCLSMVLVHFLNFRRGFHLLLLCLGCLGQICGSNALTSLCNMEVTAFRNVDVTYKFIVNGDPLGAVFAGAFCFVDFDAINQFSQERSGQVVHVHDGEDKW